MTDPFAPVTGAVAQPTDGGDVKPKNWITPVPLNAPEFTGKHFEFGEPAFTNPYRDKNGDVSFFHCRYLPRDGQGNRLVKADGELAKEDRYWTLIRDGEKMRWSFYWPARPRPLCALDHLAAHPAAPVLIVEGEKARNAGEALFPTYVVVCWVGGSSSAGHADWRVLAGRDCLIWRDHDQPGHDAQKKIAKMLRAVGASRIRAVQLETVARHCGHPLRKKFDVADLISEELYTPERAATLAAESDFAELISEPEEDSAGARHERLKVAIRAFLLTEEVKMNAVEQWSKEDHSPKPGVSTGSMARTFAMAYRDKGPVNTAMVVETMHEIGIEQSKIRRRELINTIIGQATTNEGRQSLAAFVIALTGSESPVVYHGLRHVIWNMKRTMAGKKRAHDLMPILHGAQGSGKTVAMSLFCSPLEELAQAIQSDTLTDSRAAPILGRCFMGKWDEMEGASRADMEAIKNAITCETKTYRELGTHHSGTVVRTMGFIGASNKPINAIFKDTSGMRRFLGVQTSDRCDWNVLNALSYLTLYTCVHEDEPPPIDAIMDQLKVEQAEATHKDNIALWFENETWKRFTWESIPGQAASIIPEYAADRGDLGSDIRQRYVFWCRVNAEVPAVSNQFFIRLLELKFSVWRPRENGVRVYRYRRPAPSGDDEPIVIVP